MKIKKILKISAVLLLLGALSAALGVIGLYLYLNPKLPQIDVLQDIQLQEPLRVYTKEGLLISEYGDKRRIPLEIQDIPVQLQQAFISSEDDRFYEHPGVDWQGLVRAVVVWVTTGDRKQGGSTITMQVARNFFLTREKSILRKINEIFLALKITDQLSKDKVLELYLNKIYLGKRAYGVAAAAKVYYGKTVDELTLAEIAMVAGLPKAPSRYNPIARPERALLRRNYVLGRMLALGHITQEAYELAKDSPITAKVHAVDPEVEAHYIGEMVRADIARMYPGETYASGLKVYTTVNGMQQRAANQALRDGLMMIDQRHGFRGVLSQIELPELEGGELDTEALELLMESYSEKAGLQPAVVTALSDEQCEVYIKERGQGAISLANMQWARKHINTDHVGPEITKPSDVLSKGDVVWVMINANGELALTQMPEVEGALVALNPSDGSVAALVGGFDYFNSKFNRATQALRQAGSSFKPFMYTAALDRGYTAASVINDAPVVFDDPALESKWKPENYSGKFYGPTRLRVALANSRNLVSIRLLIEQGIGPVRRYVTRFGFQPDRMPYDLSLALGSGSVTPIDLVSAYAVLANGGYRVSAYYIDRVENAAGEVIYRPQRTVTCVSCEQQTAKLDALQMITEAELEAADGSDLDNELPLPELEHQEDELEPLLLQAEQVIEPRTAYLIRSMLQDVVKRGTARRALKLGRNDLAGKTGTTNDQIDAWFAGFNDDLVASVWVGYDTLKTMGRRETGSSAALPIWVDFMEDALQNSEESKRSLPAGMVSVRIDPATGLLAHPSQNNAIFEIFREENVPTEMAIPENVQPALSEEATGLMPEDELLF